MHHAAHLIATHVFVVPQVLVQLALQDQAWRLGDTAGDADALLLLRRPEGDAESDLREPRQFAATAHAGRGWLTYALAPGSARPTLARAS